MHTAVHVGLLFIVWQLAALLPAGRALAVSGTWNVNASGDWSTPGNWLSSTVADGTDSTANFIFDITADRTINVDVPRTIGHIKFQDVSSTSRFILSGNTITLGVSSGTPTIGVIGTTDVATIDSVLAGSAGLRIVDTGILTLGGTNTYTGATTISSGTVRMTNTAALGVSTSTVTLADASSGINTIGLMADIAMTFSRDLHVTNNGTGLVNIGAFGVSATYSGDLQLDRSVVFQTDSGAVVTFGGIISGAGGIGRNGNSYNTVILNGVNTYTGNTTITNGNIYVGGDALLNTDGPLGNSSAVIPVSGNGGVLTNGAFTVARDFQVNSGTAHFGSVATGDSFFTGDIVTNSAGPMEFKVPSGGKVTFSGDISGSGGFNKTSTLLSSAGIVALTGNNSFTGNSTLNNGTLQLGSDTALGSGAGTFIVSAVATTIEAIGGPRTIANDWNFVRAPVFGGSEDLTFNGNGVLGFTFAQNFSTNATTTFNGNFGNALLGFAFTKTGPGDLVLNGNNTYNGVVTVSTGRLIVGGNNALGIVADGTTVSSGATLGFHNNVNYTATETLTVTGAGVASQGAINNISGNNRFAGAINMTGATTIGATAGSLHLTGNIGGGTALTIAGGGIVALDGNVVTSGVSVQSGATLGGSGTINAAISGAGQVGPGASPGILTATQINPTGGLDFNFELTQYTPDYTDAFASGNDVLRLTHATTPFTTSLTAANEINVYFNLANFSDQNGDYTGGFYTDMNSSFAASISSATINYFARFEGGSIDYLGVEYEPFATAFPDASIFMSVVNAPGMQFGQDGFVMQFTVAGLPTIPEPSSLTLLGLGALVLTRRHRRRTAA